MKEFETKKRIIGFFRQNEGEFISGEAISSALGFSRAGLWKYIKKLREEGYSIEAVSNLGYRLLSSPDKIYGYELSQNLKTRILGKKEIHHFETIASTNTKAYELAESGEPEGTIVIAESQSHGKGRIGRKWVSPKTGGIYISLILRPDAADIEEVPAIALIAAKAVIRAIKKTSGIDAGMKWPNDVLISGKKVAGILAEMKAQPDRVDFLVLGVGINVNTALDKLPPEGTSIFAQTSNKIERRDVLKIFLEEFEQYYLTFQKKGFSVLRPGCKKMSLVLGKKVCVLEHDKKVSGRAVDIGGKGALIIETDKGEKSRIFSGDVVSCR